MNVSGKQCEANARNKLFWGTKIWHRFSAALGLSLTGSYQTGSYQAGSYQAGSLKRYFGLTLVVTFHAFCGNVYMIMSWFVCSWRGVGVVQ